MDAMAEIQEAIRGREFGSLEELNAFMRDLNDQRNRRPLEDFHGLSSEQMHRFLHFPFESPELVTFPTCLDSPPTAPIVTLFELLAAGIGEQGLKPTAKGNLPQKFVQEAALVYGSKVEARRLPPYVNVRNEQDLVDLNVARIIAEASGLIRKSKSKFILGHDCRKILAKQGLAGIYPRLLKAHAWKFNWAYWDGHPDLPMCQQSFLFTLYPLRRYGSQWRPMTFYEDAFLRAFPKLLEETPPTPYETAEGRIRHRYSYRCLEDFAGFLGLVEIERETEERFDLSFKVRSAPLLGQAVQFQFPIGGG